MQRSDLLYRSKAAGIAPNRSEAAAPTSFRSEAVFAQHGTRFRAQEDVPLPQGRLNKLIIVCPNITITVELQSCRLPLGTVFAPPRQDTLVYRITTSRDLVPGDAKARLGVTFNMCVCVMFIILLNVTMNYNSQSII